MGLSNELIAQFAKLTKTERNTKTESTHNGTIKIVDNAKYVKLDGSDQLTPISTTADIHDGDRVTVMIKNHSATVTGNITSPSARTNDLQETAGKVDGWDSRITDVEILVADKVSTTEFDAQTGRIDNLVSDNVVIKDTLTANTAIVEEIKAENVVISERLDATEAYIENLETNFLTVEIADIRYASIEELEAIDADVYNLNATYATFETTTTNRLSAIDATISDLDATYATIDDLVVERARIDVIEAGQLGADSALIKQLQSDVADISTLMFGSASGDVIQSSFSNAVIAQLGNAQIKSAMIESVSANKITAGDIITNNVRVMSEDGKLLISDETIQISDNSRVRVQIGKDAAGDYSINIWDEAGNLMFSEGGITDSAIKQAIIRDNMISDTANISAYKLNINSLFEVINGSTNTIKATRIYLDDESQTLNVAFTSLSSDVNSLENTVTSQGTELSIIQGQISSKVWQEDIDASSDLMSTKYSSLEQTVDSMNVVIASHTNQVETLSDKMTSVETNLNGFKTTVSDTYATKSEVSELQITSDGLVARVADMATTEDIANINSSNELTEERMASAESLLQQLANSMSMLVTDGNGESLMVQTENGWTFSTNEIQEAVNSALENLNDLINEVGDTASTVDTLKQAVSDLGILNDYVKIGTYENEPCIELGESDSDFKLLITNTRIMFMEGSGVPAYLNNQSLFIKKAVVEEELQQGQFVWKVRANGNLGLIWKGAAN